MQCAFTVLMAFGFDLAWIERHVEENADVIADSLDRIVRIEDRQDFSPRVREFAADFRNWLVSGPEWTAPEVESDA